MKLQSAFPNFSPAKLCHAKHGREQWLRLMNLQRAARPSVGNTFGHDEHLRRQLQYNKLQTASGEGTAPMFALMKNHHCKSAYSKRNTSAAQHFSSSPVTKKYILSNTVKTIGIFCNPVVLLTCCILERIRAMNAGAKENFFSARRVPNLMQQVIDKCLF
ncbi:hypothetical protein [Noviherbaspirillum massiliense]|uniref:hypothetical protein n=1 Tax=Noviherbaspirillum massiliense TaxID=1465823 RepID=UPI0011DD26B3|nr:hypothetical protein [Noviherbaspirillum massiliense]